MNPKQQEQTLFELINAYRTQNAKNALTWNVTFKKPAAWMSKDMLTTRNLSHTDSLGRNSAVRLADCGVEVTQSYGENIASGAPSARDVLDAWKNSPPHNAILLNNAFTYGAVAMEVDQTGELAFWTFDAGGSSTVQPTSTNPTGITGIPTGITGSPTGITGAPTGVTGAPTLITPTGLLSVTPSKGKDPTPTTGPIGVDVQINVKVKIIGIGRGGNQSPKNLTRRVTAMVYGTAPEPVATGNSFLTYDNQEYFTGVIRLGKLSQGPYFIKLVGDNTLATLAKPEFQNLKIDTVNTVPPVNLYQGDINRDNVINIDDYNEVLPCFQQKRCDQAKAIDFNDDGLTDAKDYNLLLRSFMEQPGS